MHVFLGPFHPYLENAFIDEVRRYKSSDLLTPLLVLVPSDAIRRRLKVLLALDHRLDLINLQILTFHQLSRQLYEEKYGVSDPDLREDIFIEETLRNLIRKDAATGSPFAGLDEMEGGCAALWQTLRDLKDGLVDPDVVIQAVKEGHFGKEATEKVLSLLKCFLDLKDRCAAGSIRDYTDLDMMVIDQVPSSRFLGQFHHIFHYGFYDLTQVQIEQFQSVARHYSTTLFFPLIAGHPGWVFAQRFYDRYVQALASDPSQITDLHEGQPDAASIRSFTGLFSEGFSEDSEKVQTTGPSCTIISCSGTRDETLTVAKETLRLVTDEGVSFGDIGVVARNLSAYASAIMDIFPRHGIPVSSTAQEPVVRDPLAKAVLLLTGLSLHDYVRPEVIDLLTSPYFDVGSSCPEGVPPRPDLWDGLTRRIGVTKGLDKWKRLKRYIDREARRKADNEKKDHADQRLILCEQAQCLWQTFMPLHRDMGGLPAKAGWSDYVAHWKRLFKKYLSLARPEEKGIGGNEPQQCPKDEVIMETVMEVILDTLESLAALDAVVSPVSMKHFIETFTRWLERAFVPISEQNISGVSVMDTMAARGLPIKILFLLGINEGIFPRTIREDAFLRDGQRRSLETTLGYKVGEKLAGYDEEKLLFTLLVGAAGERLYCLYRRSDEKGKPLAPSWYLTEFRKALADHVQERVIPRGLLEKQEETPFDRADLHTPQELAVYSSLTSQDPGPLFAQLPLSQALYDHGRRALKTIEDKEQLSPHDGMVGSIPDFWKGIQHDGVSPTALERYAECPFKYFGTQLLGLRLLDRPEEDTGLEPVDTGTLCHAILKAVYEALLNQAFFQNDAPNTDCRKIIEAVSRKIFSKYEADNPVSYPVIWEDLKENIVDLVEAVTKHDRSNLFQPGDAPPALEVACEGPLESGWPNIQDIPDIIKDLTIRGRIDRIDYQADQKRYRVVDYKYKTGKTQSARDKNLLLAAIRGQHLQPPLYLLLARHFAAEQKKIDTDFRAEAVFYYLAPNWNKGPVLVGEYPADGWEGEAGGMLRKTLTLLLEGIHRGRFFILPGNHCDYCDLSTICRKNHRQTLRRAAQGPLTLEHQKLRILKIPKIKTSKKRNPGPRKSRSK